MDRIILGKKSDENDRFSKYSALKGEGSGKAAFETGSKAVQGKGSSGKAVLKVATAGQDASSTQLALGKGPGAMAKRK